MKLNNILIALSFLSMLSCSKDEIDIDTSRTDELRYDATLSLAVGGEGTVVTKAGEATTVAPDSIKRLSAAIFMDDKLVAFKDSTELDEDGKELPIEKVTKHITGLDFIEVPSGNAKILLIANHAIPANSKLRTVGTATLKDYEDIVVGLSDEINGRLTMSSDILNISIAQGANFIGLSTSTGSQEIDGITGQELKGDKIDLYRSVAQVQVVSLTIDPADRYKGKDSDAEFILDTIYVANAKSKSYLFPNNATYPDAEYMPSGSKEFWCGAFHKEEGALKEGEATLEGSLCYDFVNFIKDLKPKAEAGYERLYGKYKFLNQYPGAEAWGAIDKDKQMSVKGQESITHEGGKLPVGTYYYVYENRKEKVNNTLIIVKGRYNYTPDGEQEKASFESFYAITLNKDGKITIDGDEHEYVKRNYIYSVALTIQGPGSSAPYDKKMSANISASVKVKQWNVIRQDEIVE